VGGDVVPAAAASIRVVEGRDSGGDRCCGGGGWTGRGAGDGGRRDAGVRLRNGWKKEGGPAQKSDTGVADG
jgi:hypothetical protein